MEGGLLLKHHHFFVKWSNHYYNEYFCLLSKMQMKYLPVLLIILFIVLVPSLKAQQNHFIYIQNENHQSFYVKLDKKTYNSSASGYVILPKLKDGTYQLSIGFPKTGVKEQNMVCTIDRTDIGFILKNFESKGWGLFNLQTLDVIMDNSAASPNTIAVVNKNDAFSNMLSEVVNDSTIRQAEPIIIETSKVKVEEKEKKSADLVAIQETPVAPKPKVEINNNVSAPISKTVDSTKLIKGNSAASGLTKSNISSSMTKKDAAGTTMIFVDKMKGGVDTITVFIAEDKLPVTIVDQKPADTKLPVVEVQPTVSIKEDKAVKPRFIDIELPVSKGGASDKIPAANVIPVSKESSSASVSKDPVDLPVAQVRQTLKVNSNCTVLASEEDLMKLRKRIMAAGSDEEKLRVTKKYLKAKCFMVEQIRNLSVLFLKEDARVSYFEIAYPFVFDSNNFIKLQNQLTDPNYINRFQSMIRN